jgi:endogenous inhibitor of DNA gyrase (YacG/DUF329 family)
MKCPICKKTVTVGKNNPFQPFCSKRCKMVDLGKWLDEKYVIPDDPVSPSPKDPKEDQG